MRTKDVLQMVYGGSHGFGTRLAEIADDLVRDYEQRVTQREAEAHVRDQVAGQGPMLEMLCHTLKQAQREALTDSRLPAVMTFDAYCIVKDASKSSPGDRGLKHAAHALYDRWNQDPMGHMTVGEMVNYRDHFVDMFPKSAVKNVFDHEIPESGFNTLTNLPFLTRIASDIHDQQSYEDVVESNGLSGDRPEEIRARAYLKAVAELTLSDESFEIQIPTVQDALDRVVTRYAQEMFDDSEGMEDEGMDDEFMDEDEDMDDDADDDVMLDEESEYPHDENSEEMATIESPISGEELVLELGMADDGIEGMEPEEQENLEVTTENLPDMSPFEMTGQFEDEMDDGMDDSMADEPMSMEDFEDGGEFEEEEAEEVSSFITDPSSGQTLEVTLSPVDEEPSGEDMGDEGESMFDMEDEPEDLQGDMDELGGGDGFDMGLEAESHRYANKSRRARSKDQAPTEGEPESMESGMNPGKPSPQPNAKPQGKLPDVGEFSGGHREKKSKKPKKPKKAQALTKAQINEACAAMGFTAQSIEETLLNGDELAVGAYALRIGPSDDVELRKLKAENTTRGAKVIRSASLAEFDEVVSDFMALSAAQYAIGQQERSAIEAPAKKAAGKAKGQSESGSFVITSDVPAGAPINARRMMSAVWKVSPDAEGELMDDGRLSILVRSAQARDINRVKRVLSDVFGVRRIEAQMVNLDSPYKGQTPVPNQPAGAPAQPMQAPMQTPQVGSGAQTAFIQQHTDPMDGMPMTPMKQAEGEECSECGDMKCAGCGEGHRQAQLDEEIADDEMLDEEIENLEDPGLDEELGMEPGFEPDMGMAPGMAPDMGMAPGMDPMMMGDASQMPIDMGSGQLQPEDEEAVRAAMMHFRNMGMMPLEAIDKFKSSYDGMLDKYGDDASPQRALAEAAIIRSMTEAYQQPAIIPAKRAEMPTPKPMMQQPGKVQVSKDFPQGDLPTPGKPKSQVVPQGEKPDTNMSHGDTSSHNWGGAKKPKGPQSGSQTMNQGEQLPSVENLAHGDPSNHNFGPKPINPKSKYLSKNVAKGASEDLIVRFDPEYGEFLLHRADKKIAVHASLSDALADAEKRQFGSDARIFIDDGQGGYDEI